MEDPPPSSFSKEAHTSTPIAASNRKENGSPFIAASAGLVNNDTITYKYEHVLSTITVLQQELEKTALLASTLKSENEMLRRNYNDVQQSLSRTQKRLKEANKLTSIPQDPTTTMLSEKEELLVQYRAQLDQCNKELEVALGQRNAAVMACEETIRQRLKEELLLIENNTRGSYPGSKESFLEKELEKWKNDYYQLKKESEHYKATHQNNIDIVSERELALEGEIVSLRLSIEKLVQGRTCCLQSCEKNKEISTLELQLKDQDAIILSLRSHVSKVQKERDQQELANIGLLARHQEDLVPLFKQVSMLEADKKLLEKRCESIQVELKQTLDVNSELRERIIALNKETCKLRLEQSSRLPAQRESREAELLEDYKKRELRYTSKIKSIEHQMDELRKERIEAIQAISTEKQLALEKQKQKNSNTENLLETSEKFLKQLQEQIMDNQVQFEKYEAEWKSKESEYASVVEKLKHECELHRITAERLTTEKDAIVRRAVAAEKKSDQMKASMIPLHQEMTLKTEENDSLINQLTVAERKITELETARDRLLTEAVRGKEDLELVKKSYEDKLSLYQTKIELITVELAREKKVSKCYKEKAIDAHKKTRLAKQTLEQCYVPIGESI